LDNPFVITEFNNELQIKLRQVTMNRESNSEMRLREFAPVVIEELTEAGRGFTFEEYVIYFSSYMESGSRTII
jgi:hypothetical protein